MDPMYWVLHDPAPYPYARPIEKYEDDEELPPQPSLPPVPCVRVSYPGAEYAGTM